jgi:UDP-N-acetylglucosamine 1-carboxyvinyltransferase
MSSFSITGGSALQGSIAPMGNKNEALPALAAALVPGERVVLENIPQIRDVHTMLALLEAIGARTEWLGTHTVEIEANGPLDCRPPPSLLSEIRASFLLAAPLLSRTGNVFITPPGGDRIGRRRLDPHLEAFSAFGVDVRWSHDVIELRVPPGGLSPASIQLDEASVMATENAVILASTIPGRSVIYPAACEPHVQGLCRLLTSMGSKIEGMGSNRLVVEGNTEHRGATHHIAPDHIEVGSFIGLAATTGSDLTIGPVIHPDLDPVLRPFKKLGITVRASGEFIHCFGSEPFSVMPDTGGAVPRIADGPWPAVPADLLSILVVTATQARGTVLLFERMFESRMFWVDRLIAMGANVVLCDPHRVVVVGPSELQGTKVASPDIRAGMALLIAALAAEGESEIYSIEQIDRGYESIDVRLSELGASIIRQEQ